MKKLNWVSGSTHSYLKSWIRAFFEKLVFDPTSALVHAVFLAGALFLFIKRRSLCIKRACFDNCIVEKTSV